MAGIINIGVSALNAFKRQMETTGHNIANVNTPGYSRQVVQFEARPAQVSAQGYVGSGVDAGAVQRRYDQFLADRVREYSASHQEFAVYEQRARQIDSVLADASAGIDGMMQQFFASVNDVADDPTSIAARTVMLDRAEQLAGRFNALDGWLEDIRHHLNRDLGNQVGEVNELARSLAQVNGRIINLAGTPGGIPGDVLDERDRLLDRLSGFTSISTVEQSDGAMNVFIGSGQALVVGASHNTLGLIDNPAAVDRKEIVINQPGGISANVTSQMSGGSLGGLLRFRDEVLDPAQNGLGRVAIGLVDFFNAEHRSGMDLDGDLGVDFFANAAPQVMANRSNGPGSAISVAFGDVADLTAHEYELRYDGTDWTLTDLQNGAVVTMSGSGAAGNPFVAHGMEIEIGSAVAGDSYRLRPTRAGAGGIGLLIGNARDIAAAEPVRNASGTANSGTAVISGGALTERTGDTRLAAPVSLTFNAALNRFDLSTGGSVAYDPASDSGSTLTVSLANLGDYSFSITGTPANGDVFELRDNAGGVGDNRNARRLADLQNANLMIGGTASIADTYGALIADVATRTHQAGSAAGVQKHLLGQAEASKSEVSGVNLDEEAADLVRFQQAYQAAAQVISVANSLFDSLLAAVRR